MYRQIKNAAIGFVLFAAIAVVVGCGIPKTDWECDGAGNCVYVEIEIDEVTGDIKYRHTHRVAKSGGNRCSVSCLWSV